MIHTFGFIFTSDQIKSAKFTLNVFDPTGSVERTDDIIFVPPLTFVDLTLDFLLEILLYLKLLMHTQIQN